MQVEEQQQQEQQQQQQAQSANGGFAGEPMIEVRGLTKRYGRQVAVEDVSFTVGRGEIVGLLGPNGAGKSTTMRILSCFLPASSGTVRVAGYDVFRDSEEVRRRIGYMPENNPLHFEMRVREYLKFRARLKGLGTARSRDRVAMVMEQCGLTGVSDRIIGNLSKGYRQRVGLADALVHEPDLIILDEPTIGLDPHQIRAVRQLIQGLSPQHTVLISSHILPEVEMTCQRVLILYRGRLLAADTREELQRRMSAGSQVVAELAAPYEDLRVVCEEMQGVEHFDLSRLNAEVCRVAITPRDGADLRTHFYEIVVKRGWVLRELTRTKHSLEDIFLHVTRPNREGEDAP